MIRLWRRSRVDQTAPMIYFAHIGKTAGTSFRHAAIRRFGKPPASLTLSADLRPTIVFTNAHAATYCRSAKAWLSMVSLYHSQERSSGAQ